MDLEIFPWGLDWVKEVLTEVPGVLQEVLNEATVSVRRFPQVFMETQVLLGKLPEVLERVRQSCYHQSHFHGYLQSRTADLKSAGGVPLNTFY